jgi:hypothetical protein
MAIKSINLEALKDPSWWHWALTVPLLAADVSGIRYAIETAIVLCAAMTGYYLIRIRAVKPFPVQIRLGYLTWLMFGLIPGFFWMHWIALFGTTAMVTVGYCPLHRMLKLLPFNRNEPLTGALVWRVFVTDPCAGGLIRWSRENGSTEASPCSMSSEKTGSPCSWNDSSTPRERTRHAQTH